MAFSEPLLNYHHLWVLSPQQNDGAERHIVFKVTLEQRTARYWDGDEVRWGWMLG